MNYGQKTKSMAKSKKSLYYDLLEDLTDKIDLDDSQSIAKYAPGVPKDIRVFLGRLSMLQDVPYHYLVPDARLVNMHKEDGKEIGALRFFWIDPLWVQSLLSGALSVGEDYDASYLLKEAMAGNYIAEVFHEDTVKRLKDQLSGSYSPEDLKTELLKRLNADQAYKLTEVNEIRPPSVSQTNWRYTGFLLRSSIVSGIKGLEVTAKGLDQYNDKKEPRKLSVLRVEYISDDTLFCLCEGIITQVVITQPAENLHFGFNVDRNNEYYKLVDEKKKVPIRQRNNKRTLKFNGEDGIIAALSAAIGKTTAGDPIGPGEVALHLLAKPVRHTVTIDWQKEKIITDGKSQHE